MLNLKLVRLLRGRPQFDLVVESRIPEYQLLLIENEKIEPSNDELADLALALSTSPEQLRKQITEALPH